MLPASKLLTVVTPQIKAIRACQCTSVLVCHTPVLPAVHSSTGRLGGAHKWQAAAHRSLFLCGTAPISVACGCVSCPTTSSGWRSCAGRACWSLRCLLRGGHRTLWAHWVPQDTAVRPHDTTQNSEEVNTPDHSLSVT